MTKGLLRSLARAPKLRQGPATLAIPIRNKAVAITDPGAAVAYGTAVLGALPPGNLVYLGAVAYLKMSSASAGLSATYNATAAVGTGATADATLSGAEVDLLAAAAAGAATAKVSPMLRLASTDALGGGIIDNTAGNLNANLNVTVPDADISAGSSITVNGVLYLSFVTWERCKAVAEDVRGRLRLLVRRICATPAGAANSSDTVSVPAR